MKKELFSRGMRMVHKFGEIEKRTDPLEVNTFDFKPPIFPQMRSGPLEVQKLGEHSYRPEPSPVSKPDGGLATLNGPTPDRDEAFSRPIPPNTKKRKQP